MADADVNFAQLCL